MKRFSSFRMESSHGEIELDANGVPTLLNVDDDADGTPCYLRNVAKFDVEEFYEYLANGWGDKPFEVEDGKPCDGDVLDMGYWTKDGKYSPPTQSWRENVFRQ